MSNIFVHNIVIAPIGEKEWVKVMFSNGDIWIPKLSELAEIANKIGVCEDRKYGHPKHNVKGAEMVADYLREAIFNAFNEEEIKFLNEKYEIPI